MSESEKFMPFENRLDLTELHDKMQQIKTEINKVIVGQKQMIDLMLISILAQGHSLIEGVPGIAKTVTTKLLAKTLDTSFSRIQFTPDLMPADVIGTSVLNLKTNEFEFKNGPIFSNIVLIDEINRAPAKTQAALFECMSERQITVDGNTYQLPPPFLVLATQNPVDHEGTYRLPEAQLDRFLFKIDITYPALQEEIGILKAQHERKNVDKESLVKPVIKEKEIVAFQQLIKQVYAHEQLIEYIAKIVDSTRNNANLTLGASPRASIAILESAKAFAAINGRDFITPEDIKMVAYPVMGHRVMLAPEREMEGFNASKIIHQIIDSVEIPR